MAGAVSLGVWLATPGRLFDVAGFPPRWFCGDWDASLGWLHIASDVAIFGAYAAIPLVILHFLRRRRDVPFSNLFLLFGAFIFACGLTHLADAVIFWVPVYRFGGVLKILTAVVSWMTVLALVPLVPKALAWPSLATANAELEREIEERAAAEKRADDARCLAERYLAESMRAEQRANRLIEASPSAMVAIDRDGRIVLVNSLAEALFGHPRQAMLGQAVETLLPERFRAAHVTHRSGYASAPQVRAMGAGRDLFALRGDGSEFPVEIGLNPIDTPDGPMVLAVIVDITERKMAEALLRQTVAELASTNHELELFAYMASHDLQEPLRKLISFAGLLVEDVGADLPESARVDLHYITDAAARMQALVRGLLDLSRAGRGELQEAPVRLDDCVDAALASLGDRVEAAAARIERQPLPTVLGNQALLTTLYQNLLGNALKFTKPEGGAVLRVEACESADGWVFGVADNGIGLDPTYADSIFEPFRRLHGRREYEGTGIGLAVCRKAVERHGGRIWVESKPGQGAHFRFTLKGVVNAATAAAGAPAANEGGASRQP
ncbi:MAG: ATP-binding protein [Planctomycetota bacterium]